MELAEALEKIGSPFNPDRHEVVECIWVAGARHKTGQPDLFVYRHKIKGSFVLAKWLRKPMAEGGAGLMVELKVLGGQPDCGNIPVVDNMDAGNDSFGLPSESLLHELVNQQQDIWNGWKEHCEEKEAERRRKNADSKMHRDDVVARMNHYQTEHNKNKPSITDIRDGRRPWSDDPGLMGGIEL